TRGVFLALTLGTFYAIARFKARRHQVVLSLFALGLIWLDGLTQVPNLNPTVPPAVLEPGLPNIQRLVPFRVMENPGSCLARRPPSGFGPPCFPTWPTLTLDTGWDST